MKKIAVDLIVFDLDGTLAHTLLDLANAANATCRQLGLPEHPPEAVKGMIGGGERKFIEHLLGPGNQHRLEEAMEHYLKHYRRHCGDLTRLYPGVPETLDGLAGKKLAVLSNKRHDLTELVLQVMGIRPYFVAVRGGGEGLPLKPSAAPLEALVCDLGFSIDRTLMVGDKATDIAAGRGAGTFTAGVTYGYGEARDLRAAAPHFLLDRFVELIEIIL